MLTAVNMCVDFRISPDHLCVTNYCCFFSRWGFLFDLSGIFDQNKTYQGTLELYSFVQHFWN